VDFTHNFNHPLYLVAFVMFTGAALWLFIDPLKQLHLQRLTPAHA
jgi:hypothetical protein